MVNEGKEDDAKKLINTLNDLEPVLAPDAAETNYWVFITMAQEKQVDYGTYLTKKSTDTKLGYSVCGAQVFGDYDATNTGGNAARIGSYATGEALVAKNECTDKIAVVTFFEKATLWDEANFSYY